MKRKLCRAVACPRKIADTALFCQVHINQLSPRLLSPIAANTEAPRAASVETRARIAAAVDAAVTSLAKGEGRASELARARRSQSIQAGQGGVSPAGEARENETSRFNLDVDKR